MYAIENAWGGELFVPKIPSYKILDVAKAVAHECKTEVIGIRPGEKLHEEMITETDSLSTFDCGKYYVIAPSVHTWKMEDWMKTFNAKKVPEGFKYNSETNNEWISPDEIKKLIKIHIDPNFSA
jgi:FlaA1/EpsC-like NDP-sugar epimerase